MNYAQFKKIEQFSPSITDAFMKLIGVEMSVCHKGIVNDPFPNANEKGRLPKIPKKVRLFEVTITRKKTSKCIVLDFCNYDKNNRDVPTFYSVIASLPKYELDSFEYWCHSFGANKNAISDLNIYNHQVILAKSVVDFFTVKELEQLEKVY